MSNSIKITLSGSMLTGNAGKELSRALMHDIRLISKELENEVAQEIPEGATGEARRGVDSEVKNKQVKIEARVHETGPAKEYIEVIERGRRPNKRMPPPEPIERWLKFSSRGRQFVNEIASKYGLDKEAALKRATYLKVRAIGRYGTPAQKPYEKTFKKRKAWINKKLKATVARFANGLR